MRKASRVEEAPADGLKLLAEARQQGRVGSRWLRMTHEDYEEWAKREILFLWEAVALFHHLNPHSCKPSGRAVPKPLCGTALADALMVMLGADLPDTRERRISESYARARHAVRDGKLRALEGGTESKVLVRIEDFTRWARAEALPVVGPWDERGGDKANVDQLPDEAPLVKAAQAAYNHFKSEYETARKTGGAIKHAPVANWVARTQGLSYPQGLSVARLLDPRDPGDRAGRHRTASSC